MRWLLAAALVLAPACWRGDGDAIGPTAPTTAQPAVEAGLTREAAAAILAKLKPRDRAVLGELWYMYELQDIEGDEREPERLLQRLRQEFAHPVVADPAKMQQALAEAAKIYDSVRGSTVDLYEQSDKIAAPVTAIILDPKACTTRMLAFPRDVAAAWFVEQYFSERHYHEYRMKERMFDLLATKFGRLALVVIEDRLRETLPDDASSPVSGANWKRATDAARAILGREFSAWYKRIRGHSYVEDLDAGDVLDP